MAMSHASAHWDVEPRAGEAPGEYEDGVWKLWREASGFWQCYTGVFSGDGRTVEGGRESSAEGPRRKDDVDLNYVRPG